MTTKSRATPISKQVLKDDKVGTLTMDLYRGGTMKGVLRDRGGLKIGAADIKMQNVTQSKIRTGKTSDGAKDRGYYEIASVARAGDRIKVDVSWSVPPGGPPNVNFSGTVIMHETPPEE